MVQRALLSSFKGQSGLLEFVESGLKQLYNKLGRFPDEFIEMFLPTS